ncbi:hypothetical protein CC80DRAFT_109141 [Byssothecium circinans]|uniref:Uncharacterized protein n=1 Tax=Byssothecium circinans TaxID=147558 RepID=A0A6A5TQG2_9PLEO|nr:hypothetical protein CC80DRAFT_109141 [Byssothecium circinans]
MQRLDSCRIVFPAPSCYPPNRRQMRSSTGTFVTIINHAAARKSRPRRRQRSRNQKGVEMNNVKREDCASREPLKRNNGRVAVDAIHYTRRPLSVYQLSARLPLRSPLTSRPLASPPRPQRQQTEQAQTRPGGLFLTGLRAVIGPGAAVQHARASWSPRGSSARRPAVGQGVRAAWVCRRR